MRKILKELDSIYGRKDILKSIIIFLFILFIWSTFEDKLMGLFNIYIFPLLSSIKFNDCNIIIYSIIIIIIVIYLIYLIIKCIKNKRFFPYSLVLGLSLFVYIYFQYRFYKNEYTSLPNIIEYEIGYSDIIVGLLSIFLFACIYVYFTPLIAYINTSFISSQTNNNLNFKFLSDIPINDTKSDILGFKENANTLAKYIETIETINNSFSIGLTAPWGAGKTSYLNLLANSLNKGKFIVIKFNPRHSKHIENIQEDFFNELFSVLKKYDKRLSSSFTNYLKAISVIEKKNILSSFLNLYTIWNKDLEKNKINRTICRLDKKIAVFIDDFDRLLSGEIIEVFKLINENASFSNLIFITAYDKEYMNEIINKKYSNGDKAFSDKFFISEIQIPLYPYDKILEYLLNCLFRGINMDTESENLFKETLKNYDELFKKYLITLRDVKRFLNFFVIGYTQIKEYVEFKDYFLLSLIKYRYPKEYSNLHKYKEKYLDTRIEEPDCYFLKAIVDEEDIISKDILHILFPEGSNFSYCSINNTKAFNRYFYNVINSEQLSKAEIESIFGKELIDMENHIDEWVKNGKVEDLFSYFYFDDIQNCKNKKRFESYLNILSYMYFKDYNNLIFRAKIISLLGVETKKRILENCKYEDKEYNDIILGKLKGNYPNYPFNITRGIIIGIINNEFKDNMIFSKEDILSISKSALDDLIEHDNQFKQIHIDLLYGCVDSIDQKTRIVTLDKESCSKIKKIIENDPTGYFQDFVRLGRYSSHPDYNSIACEPYWRQIFGTPEEFERIISSESLTIPNITLIRNFWKLYKENNYKPIEFENKGNVQNKINNNLKNEIRKLERILEIEHEFDNFEIDRCRSMRSGEKAYYLNQYNRLLNEIMNIELDIVKRERIRQKITKANNLINMT
ncbi:hypothetical protein EZS27_019012 [termite gut metagenome]|uniref:KAP NTPase domain-containing protein n=1 Tax=termite gut metagenome TaxID=433724 RepID=A0A5J4REK5_9ZZZZ